jgi:hypothetical protein
MTIPAYPGGGAAWNSTNGIGIELTFNVAVGSAVVGVRSDPIGTWVNLPSSTGYFNGSTLANNTTWGKAVGNVFFITGVQLEVGVTATSFDYRPYGTELALCQRYAFTTSGEYAGQSFATTQAGIPIPFPVVMRAVPTGSLITNGNLVAAAGASLAVTGTAAFVGNLTTARFNFTVASGLVIGDATFILGSSILCSAEL